MQFRMLYNDQTTSTKQPRSQREHRRHQPQPVSSSEHGNSRIVRDLYINRRTSRNVRRIGDDNIN